MSIQKFNISGPPGECLKLVVDTQNTEDMKKWLDMVGKGFVLNFSANRATATPHVDGWTVELELSPAKGMIHILDARPFYERWWSAIKLFWFRNSYPELWKDV